MNATVMEEQTMTETEETKVILSVLTFYGLTKKENYQVFLLIAIFHIC